MKHADALLEKAAERIGVLTVENDLLRLEGMELQQTVEAQQGQLDAAAQRIVDLERTLGEKIEAELKRQRKDQPAPTGNHARASRRRKTSS